MIAAGGVLDGDETTWLYEGERICTGQDPEGNVFQVRGPAGRGSAGSA